MADFYQGGVIATLHELNSNGLEMLESKLEVFSQYRPVALVLPALYSEFETPAMRRIVEELAQVRYLRQIVVALGRATAEEFERARAFFDSFTAPVTFLWISGERIQKLFELLEERGLSVGEDGKGRSCWLALGYLLAAGDCDVIALHDCDILNYDRRMLARLLFPVANPNLSFEFCKGYYARVNNNTLYGRVSRLFMTPLLRAMENMTPGAAYLRFLDSFRYPLAGEFVMTSNLARVNRIPWDWGLEVGVLAEIYRNCELSRICQVDVSDTYEHKHQALSADDPGAGLRRMTCDIAKSLFRTMAGEGLVFTKDHFLGLEVRYVRMAEDMIDRYYADAVLNGLQFDRHAEEVAVAAFAASLRQAAQEFFEKPLGLPLMPNWNRVLSAVPEFLPMLMDVVREDARTEVEVGGRR